MTWLLEDDLVTAAERVARSAHQGQTDKAGSPYIEHPRRVAERVRTFGPIAVAAAWLHDVVEDCRVTPADLVKAHFPVAVVEAVEALTKRAGESHGDAVRRACANPVAKVVKAADVADNSDPERLTRLERALADRLRQKYAAAAAILQEAGAPRFDG